GRGGRGPGASSRRDRCGSPMKRVAVTGIGAVTPIGTGRETFWKGLLEGKSGIGRVTSFDSADYPVHIGGEVRDFAPERHLRRLNPETTGRASQFAAAAAHLALADAGIDVTTYNRKRVGVSMGTTSGEPLFVEQYNNIRKADGEAAIP